MLLYICNNNIYIINYIIANKKFVNGSAISALGTSFGGYMSNWMNGHSKRFKSFVVCNGKFNTQMTYFTTDELYFPEHDFGGTPWESEEKYVKWSPLTYLNNCSTPTMIVQGSKGMKSHFLYYIYIYFKKIIE